MIYDCDELSFQVFSAVRFTNQAGIFEVKPRPFAALSFRLSGEGYFEIGEKSFTVRAGDVLYIPADVPYRVEYSANEILVIHLLSCNYAEPELIRVKNAAAVEAHFMRLLESQEGNGSAHLAKARVYELMDLLARESADGRSQGMLARCVAYLEAHFHETELSVDTVCRRLYISRSTVQRLFAQACGVSPAQYLARLRIEHALRLLACSSLTVREVALACGFSDEKYFSRVFKKAYGRPPSHLRGGPV